MNNRDRIASAQIGDIIRCTDYYIGRMAAGGPFRCEDMIGTVAVVTSFNEYVYSGSNPLRYGVYARGVKTKNGDAVFLSFDTADRSTFELVLKGDGTCTPGVDFEFSNHEIYLDEVKALRLQIASFDWRYEGFANRATYTAHLYLCNEAHFEQMLPSLCRRDGTINPNKVEKAFRDLRLRLEPELFEAPFQVDAKFRNAQLGLGAKVQVNWAEVAHEFRLKDEDK